MNTEYEKIAQILFYQYSWNSKEMDEGSFKIQDVIDATKQALIMPNVSTQREAFNAFFKYLDNLTKTEYDANSLTGHGEDYLKSI